MPAKRALRSLALAALAGGSAACSGGSSDSTLQVNGTDDACALAEPTAEVRAGRIEFDFTNMAGDVSELYVLRENGDVVAEVENVTTGTSRSLTVDLVAGAYQLRCKPGQTGEGITSDFTVTGEGGSALATPDREISFDAVDFDYEDLDLTGITVGDVIRFEMTNTGTQPHEFEVLDPGGDAVGEVAAVDAGRTGGATIEFDTPGTYTFQCILVDPASGEKHTMLGMTGTFEVAGS